MRKNKQLLIGLPESGKTTFLAALWHSVESGEIESSLKLDTLCGDREYLNKIRKKWLVCKKMERTKTSSEETPSMKLRHKEKLTEVFFPDMSGETFKLQWENRKWTKSYMELIQEINGILFFVHPNNGMEKGFTIPHDESIANSKTPDTSEEWSPSKATTQSILVDILQFILWKGYLKTMKVAVIISAWDIIENNNKQHQKPLSPDCWLSERLPLLDQYLKSNTEVLSCRVYGVSAQGGELEEKTILELQSKDIQAERVKVVYGFSSESHDITKPIQWLID